jgi:hypothetical protein
MKRFMTVATIAFVIGMTSAVAEPCDGGNCATPQTQRATTQPKQQPLKTIAKKAGKVAKTIGAKAGPGKACPTHDC